MRKKIALLAVVTIALVGAYTIGSIRKQHIDEYAERNNCTWNYDNAEPICK